jgi:hypothetical protein
MNATDFTATISAASLTQGGEGSVKEGATENSVTGQETSQGTPVSPPRRNFWIIVVALIVVGAIGILIARKLRDRKGTSAPDGPPVATIKAATAHLGDMGQYVDALGTVAPVAAVNLYSQVNGTVTAVHSAEGQIAPTSLLSNQQTAASLHIQRMTSRAQLIEALSGGWNTTQLPSEKTVAAKQM